MLISPRAIALVEDLHEVWDIRERREKVQRALDAEHMETLGPGKPYSPNGTKISEALSCSDETEWAD